MNRDRWIGAALGAALVLILIIVGQVACSSRESVAPTPADPGGYPSAYPYPQATPPPPGTGYPPPGSPAPYPGPATAWPTVTGTGPHAAPWYLPLITHHYAMVTPTPTVQPTATATPTVTPVPTRPWPPTLSAPGPSKLGLHVQWNSSPDILEFVRRYRPAVVKGVNDLNYLAEVKALSPSTVTIGRIEDGSPSRDGDPAQTAREYVNRYLGIYLSHPWIDYWEGVNEPDVGGDMAWYAAFEAERARAMAEHGLRVAIGSFSTGVPEWEDFGAFLPAVQAAKAHGGVLSLHEYDAPTMTRSVGAALPGRQAVADRGALTLRYRWWYEDYLRPRGLVLPLVITEAGVDGGVTNRPGPEGGGWQDFTTYWAEQEGLGHDGTATYLQQLAWYDSELRKDDYVIGCAIFTAGPMDEKWRSFDVTGILREIGQYLVDEAAKAGAH